MARMLWSDMACGTSSGRPPFRHSWFQITPRTVGERFPRFALCERVRRGVQKFTVNVQPGDVLIAGSDGLLDNVFSTRAAKLVWDAKRRGATPGVAAQQLATFASFRSRDPAYLSPFAKQARQAGFNYQGGKVDDITVVVSYVSSGAAAAQKYGPPPPPPPPPSKL